MSLEEPRLTRLVEQIERELRLAGTADRAVNEKRYLKSELEHFGTPVPKIRKITRAAIKPLDLDREAVLSLAVTLWSKEIHERRSSAVEVLCFRGKLLQPEDAGEIERLIREAKTWALVDPLAVNVTGGLAERFPELGEVLDRWAGDEDFWVRRSAMLALLMPLRRGEGDLQRFARYADLMLEESEFFIRKAIGWVLREISKQRPDWVASWLESRTSRASGVTMREAVKYLPEARREQLMAAYRNR